MDEGGRRRCLLHPSLVARLQMQTTIGQDEESTAEPKSESKALHSAAVQQVCETNKERAETNAQVELAKGREGQAAKAVEAAIKTSRPNSVKHELEQTGDFLEV